MSWAGLPPVPGDRARPVTIRFDHAVDAVGRPSVIVVFNGNMQFSFGLDELPELFRILARQIRAARALDRRPVS